MFSAQESNDPAVLRSIVRAQAIKIMQQEIMLREARKDGLTGLSGRVDLLEAAQGALDKGQIPTSMIFADFNGLKMTNDSLGHAGGDSLIIQFAQFLNEQKEFLGEKSLLTTIARLGGDEFVILLPHTGAAEAHAFVNTIKENLAKRIFNIDGVKISLRSAMGVSTTGNGCYTVSELLGFADKAMYEDKARMKKEGEITKRID